MDGFTKARLVSRIKTLITRGQNPSGFGQMVTRPKLALRRFSQTEEVETYFEFDDGIITGWKASVVSAAELVFPRGHRAWKQIDVLEQRYGEGALSMGVALLEAMIEHLQLGISVTHPVQEAAPVGQTHTHIHGDITGNVVTNPLHSQVQQSQVSQGVAAGDLTSLLTYLRSAQIPETDLTELKSILATKSTPENPDLRNQVEGWIGRMMVKASQGVWKFAIGQAYPMLSKAIMAYWGLG